MVKMQDFVISMQAASLFPQKQMMLVKKLQYMLKQDLTLKIVSWEDHYQKEKTKRLLA